MATLSLSGTTFASRFRQMLSTRRTGDTPRFRLSTCVLGLALRCGVCVVDYLIVYITVLRIIPVLGAFIHQASGVSMESNIHGTIALWILPLCVSVLFLVIAEFYLMRALWRVTSRVIAKWKPVASTQGTASPPMGKAQRKKTKARTK